MLFESKEDLLEVVADSFPAEAATTVATLIQPAIALVATEQPTTSWVHGNAMLPEGAPWPSHAGSALVHTARIDLAGAPMVREGQPQSGHLSFFDGYPWLAEEGWTGSDSQRYNSVLYTRDEPLTVRECPLNANELEFFWPDDPTYVELAGPYYSIPSPDAVVELTSLSGGHQSLMDFSDALPDLLIEQHALGQLFGNVSAIQGHPTPRPWNVRNDTPPSLEAWDHLASFDDAVGVFEFYFSVKHGDFADLSFANTEFDCQCD